MQVLVEKNNLTVTYSTKKAPQISGAFLSSIKDTILKSKYDLSVSFIGEKEMQKINKQTRNIDKVTDILSFPLDVQSGEIYINETYAKKKAEIFEISHEDYLKYLFVHGMIHLLGHDHGDIMDALEKKFTKKLHILYPYRYTRV